MGRLEELVCPRAVPRPWRMDLAVTGLLLLVWALLVPGWNLSAGSGFSNFQAQLAGVMLLPALGMVIALRRGAIDLSVWAVMGLGGVVAASLINVGWSPGPAFAAAIAGGGALGLLSGLATAWGRVPSVISTLIVAGIALWTSHWLAAGNEVIAIPEFTFEAWKASVLELARGGQPPEPGLHGLPVVLLTRMLFVSGLWAVVIIGMVLVSRRGRQDGGNSLWWTALGALTGASVDGEADGRSGRRRRIGLMVALAVGGALAAAGGAAWLIDHGRVPVPASIVGDLRIPAAVALCGVLVCGGRGRLMLPGVWLPAALLVATLWRQQTFYLETDGYELQLVALTGEVVVAHLALRRRFTRARWDGVIRAASGLAIGSLVLFALSGLTLSPMFRGNLLLTSLAGVGLAAALLLVDFLGGRRQDRLYASGREGGDDVRGA